MMDDFDLVGEQETMDDLAGEMRTGLFESKNLEIIETLKTAIELVQNNSYDEAYNLLEEAKLMLENVRD